MMLGRRITVAAGVGFPELGNVSGSVDDNLPVIVCSISAVTGSFHV